MEILQPWAGRFHHSRESTIGKERHDASIRLHRRLDRPEGRRMTSFGAAATRAEVVEQHEVQLVEAPPTAYPSRFLRNHNQTNLHPSRRNGSRRGPHDGLRILWIPPTNRTTVKFSQVRKRHAHHGEPPWNIRVFLCSAPFERRSVFEFMPAVSPAKSLRSQSFARLPRKSEWPKNPGGKNASSSPVRSRTHWRGRTFPRK